VTRHRRIPAAVLATLLALFTAVLVASPASAAPVPTEDPADAAAGWLAGQLVDGDHLETVFDGVGYPDLGLTLDAVLAFAASGTSAGSAEAALTYVADPANLPVYVGDGTTESYAGALAKLSYATLVYGGDPTSVGGADLLARLRARQQASGRFTDASQYGDFSNAFSQAYAILALARVPGGAPAAAVGYLADQACPDGGIPLNFEQATCASDPDATAVAAQALQVGGADAAATAALDHLESIQAASGGFGGAGPTAGVNANSTGLVAQALAAGGRTEAAAASVRFLGTLQLGCTAPAAQRGAVAYDATGFDASTAPRATAQAVLGLAGIGLQALDGTDSTDDVPVLECATSPSPTGSPTSSPTSSPTASPTSSPTSSPTATVAPTTPAPTTVAPTPAPSTSAAAAPIPTSPAANGGALPNTGANVRPVIGLGVALVLVGSAGAVLFRRRPARPTA
jgi:LPXTG-motif cell wall-anchored protein